MDAYYARICWNSNGWTRPSGDAVKLESKKTYVAANGFGHEEWLFTFARIFDGFHYAYLQPVYKSRAHVSDKTIHIYLWTIDPDSRHLLIGEIQHCEVMVEAEKQRAFDHYQKEGWIEQIKNDIKKVGARCPTTLSPGDLFNVRFKPEHATQYDDPHSNTVIDKLTRYSLVAIDSPDTFQNTRRARRGSTSLPAQRKYTLPARQSSTVDPYHPILQAELMKALKRKFGGNAVLAESDYVDITVNDGKRKFLIEIKTSPNAKKAIREALGQILEYAYFREWREDTRLFILALAVITPEISAYMNLLRKYFKLPVQYCCFYPGYPLPRELCGSGV